jgi:amino acid transporter
MSFLQLVCENFVASTQTGEADFYLFSIISFLGTLALACSMAEISSIYPTAGGELPSVRSVGFLLI